MRVDWRRRHETGIRRACLVTTVILALICLFRPAGMALPRNDERLTGVCPFPIRQPPPYLPAAGTVQPARTYLTRAGDSFWSIARRFRLNLGALMAANPSYTPRYLPIGVKLRLPDGAQIETTARNATVRSRLRWPVRGRITSRYGWRWGRLHKGLDIAAPAGTIVRAAAPGRVIFAGWRSGYGLLVTIAHEQGWRTAYAHNARLLARRGQWVGTGAPLAYIGATGKATGIHLHFEVISPRGPVDPLRELP
ncbi:MAG: M23 family metallopeptidase [Bacteroidota bacterium]